MRLVSSPGIQGIDSNNVAFPATRSLLQVCSEALSWQPEVSGTLFTLDRREFEDCSSWIPDQSIRSMSS